MYPCILAWEKDVTMTKGARLNSTFTFIDLFAGIGGMRLGFESAGGVCLLTSEIDEAALTTYSSNYHPNHGHIYARDISDLDSKIIPKHDVLVAGFPCQPYSIAGLRKGLKDERGAVFMEIVRILEDKRPRSFLLENVKGILVHDQGRTFTYLVELLQDLGYFVKYETLNSMSHANIPQNRERVFIVGFRSAKRAESFTFPRKIELTKSIRDMLETSAVDKRFFYDNRYEIYPKLKSKIKSKNTLYQWRRQYVRENKSNVCPTLTANMGSGGHNVPLLRTKGGIRKLTPRECANFQGFPKSFKFPPLADSKLYHQLGNSVTVPLIRRIAVEISKALDD
jgi:DNA (cytosine-5)-methyltransferase 1